MVIKVANFSRGKGFVNFIDICCMYFVHSVLFDIPIQLWKLEGEE